MDDNYYDIPALSASGINKWWNSSPYHYWKESPFNVARVKQADTPALVFGKLCHLLAFEPEKYAQEYAIKPDADKRTKEGKTIHAEFEAANTGKSLISYEQADKAVSMQTALRNHDAVSKLLKDCKVEEPFLWQDEIPRKAKMDAFKDGLILDYKTGANIGWHDLDSYIVRMGYHRQAAYYREAFRHKHGVFPDGFVFIFQDSDFPEIIAMCSLADIGFDVGISENIEAAEDIARRLKYNDWLPPQTITEITVPNWKVQQHYKKEAGIYE